MKLFKIALEVIQEFSDQPVVSKWPLVQIALMEKGLNCYWNLNMKREYLRMYFEMLIIKGSYELIDENEFEKINEAAFELDDTLGFTFHDFFLVKDLSIDTSKEILSLDIDVFCKFKMVIAHAYFKLFCHILL